jgi:hypothetical protein
VALPEGGFAIAWTVSIASPGYPPTYSGAAQLFDAQRRPLRLPISLDTHQFPYSPPNLSQLTAMFGGGLLLPRMFIAPGSQPPVQQDFLPLASLTRTAPVPAGTFLIGGALPVASQLQALDGTGYVALLPGGIQLFGDDGVALGTLIDLPQTAERIVALRGGNFVLFWQAGGAQLYDTAGLPVGAGTTTSLADSAWYRTSVALSAGGVATVQARTLATGEAGLAIDVLAPSHQGR